MEIGLTYDVIKQIIPVQTSLKKTNTPIITLEQQIDFIRNYRIKTVDLDWGKVGFFVLTE